MYRENQQRPLHLIEVNKSGLLSINEETLDFIRSLKSPIGVLSIAGPYRTGKSYLLNSLICKDEAFEVGDTVRATTNGLWVWGKPILASDTNSKLTNVLVMDSEGFGNFQDTHDKRITTLALLISTCFLYNSRGAIDKDSIFDLEYVIDIARSICVSQNVIHKTDFHWILRDFHLELSNQLGQAITPNQYLQNSLYQSQQKVSKSTIETLKSYFPNRNCHCLVKPNLSEEQRPQFTEKIIELRKILKEIRSIDMDGKTFSQILRTYVDAMNSGQSLPKVFQEGYECRVRLNCLEKLQQELKVIEENSTTLDEIEEKINTLRKQLTRYSRQRMCSPTQLKTLEEDINDIIIQFEDEVKPKQSTSIRVFQKRPKQEIKLSTFNKGKLSVRLKQLEEEVNITKSMKDSQLKQEKNQASRLKQEYQTKIHRYELESQETQNQLSFYKQEFQTHSHRAEKLEDQLSQLTETYQKKTKEQKKSILQLQEHLQNCRNKQTLANSELIKVKSLTSEKIQFLQRCIRQNDETRKKIEKSVEEKYRNKIADMMNEINLINQQHQEELKKVKEIYKHHSEAHIRAQQLNDSKFEQNYLEQLRKHIKRSDSLARQKERAEFKNSELSNDLDNLTSKMYTMEEDHQEQLEQLIKRHKENQKCSASIFEGKLASKDQLIQQLELKIKHLSKLISENNQEHLKKLECTNQNLDEQRIKHEQALAQTNDRISELIKKSTDLALESEGKDSLILQHNRQLSSLQEEIEGYKKQINALHQQKRQEILHSNYHRNEFLNEVKGLKEKVNFLESELEEEKKVKQEITESIKSVHRMEKQHYEQKIASLQSQLPNIQTLKQLQQRSEDYYQTIATLEGELKASQQNSSWTIQKLEKRIQDLSQIITGKERQKQTLIKENITSKKDQQARYEAMENYFREIIDSQRKRYSELLTEFNNKEKELYCLKQDQQQFQQNCQKERQDFKSKFNIIRNQTDVQRKALQKQIQKAKEEKNCLLSENRQAKNELALSVQKSQFMASSMARKQVQYNSSVQAQRQNHAQTIKKMEIKANEVLEQNEKLKQLVSIYQQDQIIMISNFNSLDRSHKEQATKYNNHLRLYHSQIKQLREVNQKHQEQVQNWKKRYEDMAFLKEMVSNNYDKDYHLWSNKFRVMELKRLGLPLTGNIEKD